MEPAACLLLAEAKDGQRVGAFLGMAVEDDSAWAEWDAAFEELKHAHVVLEQLTHLPKNDPGRREATKDWNRARAAYEKACGEIAV